ncbi:MAG TPA: helicase-related protein, partial [Ktedonobacteraceae bacterium]|nr:helicase-related protein [Ktedonobacteraceae bacterium]
IRQDHGHYQRGSTIGGIGSPRQLTSCPWCGEPIDAGRDITVEPPERGRGRTFIYCGDALGRCPFSRRNAPEGLPVLVVDEEIYRCLPALLIATVDKFAQMPWNGATQMLFGQVSKRCTRHGFRCPDLDDQDQHRAIGNLPRAHSVPHAPLRPPDLLIQDELHLISGPLGTLVALYESVVDRLCSWEVDGHVVRPKVIAATATVRQASEQVHALFLRRVNVFPPQGLDARDNFFSRQRDPCEAAPGRRYLGVCAQGRRLKAALIRVYVAYLSAAQSLFQQYGQAVDPWMTMVGYFNSMNELGGMRRLVEDDVRNRLGRMQQRGLANRYPPILEELTSRRSSTDIPEVLEKLARVFDPARDKDAPRPVDVALATNMISVGVDVQRLGLMVVTGQPKTTAEYIQATSRVGRAAPGLICVVFNWARPRDLSHYEQFEHYHATFYQQVEALSVTPFAPRALDRGLAALLVSYVRLLGAEFNENSRAEHVSEARFYIQAALRELPRRAVAVTGSAAAGAEVRAALEELEAYWTMKTRATSGTRLGYKTRRDGQTIGLLRQPGQGEWLPFTCLNSLRDVEPAINLILDERGVGETLEQAASVPVESEQEDEQGRQQA